MSTTPSHLHPITIEIPVTWTAEQALDGLCEKIWTRYDCRLQDLLAEQSGHLSVDDHVPGSTDIDF